MRKKEVSAQNKPLVLQKEQLRAKLEEKRAARGENTVGLSAPDQEQDTKGFIGRVRETSATSHGGAEQAKISQKSNAEI